MKPIILLAGAAVALSGCATSPKNFYNNPGKQDTTALCRALHDTDQPQYQRDLAAELTNRGMTDESCQEKINNQNTALAVVAIGVGAVAVGAAAANGADFGGGYGYSGGGGADWDEFYNQYGQLVWACREIRTGQFTETYNCSGPKSDWRWPSKLA